MTSEQIVKKYEEKNGVRLTPAQELALTDAWTATSMSDTEFLKAYKLDDVLLNDIAACANRQNRRFMETYNLLVSLADCIMAKDYESAETRKTVRLCLNTVGDDEYVKLCLENNYPLEREDREKILELLK